jgi:hypothetical protein
LKVSIRKNFIRSLCALTGISVALCFMVGNVSAQTSNVPNIEINFNSKISNISPLNYGMSSSMQNRDAKSLATDQNIAQKFKNLKIGQIRLDVKLVNGVVVCAKEGCSTTPSADAWVNAVKAMGAQPVLSLPLNANDATGIVKHFNVDTNNPVKKWIIGNEPDAAGISADTYSNSFNAIVDSIKRIDSGSKVGGPATATYNRSFIQTFLTISGTKIDFVDYHQYGQQGSSQKPDAQLFAETANYESNYGDLKLLISNTASTKSRASQIEIQVGEWNIDKEGDTKNYSLLSTLWGVSAFGHMLNAGATSFVYSDKNGDLGLLFDYKTGNAGSSTLQAGDPMHLYHGIGMFTGENLFRGYGTSAVLVKNNLDTVTAFASDNPRNIVAINTDTAFSRQARFQLTGVGSGTVDVWRKEGSTSPLFPPGKMASTTVTNGFFTYWLTPFSTTTFIINASGSTTTPTQATTPTACSTSRRADANCDNTVDLLDFSIFRIEFPKSRDGTLVSGTAKADFDRDGDVDLSDFEIFRQELVKLQKAAA